MEQKPTFEKVIKIIEHARGELVDLCLQLGNTPSPHGQERVVGTRSICYGPPRQRDHLSGTPSRAMKIED